MIELNEYQKELLIDLFDLWNNNNIRYVVLRKYECLPNQVPEKTGGWDIDILVHKNDKKELEKLATNLGFGLGKNNNEGQTNLVLKSLRNPVKAVLFAINNPSKIKRILYSRRTDTNSMSYKTHYNNEGVLLDIVTEIKYKSPMTGTMYPVDERISKLLIKRSRKTNDLFYSPSSPDELVHIISHCLYDREGEFSNYYINRCEQLLERVESEQKEQQLKNLLEFTFFNASSLVYDEIRQCNYNNLLNNLKSYRNY